MYKERNPHLVCTQSGACCLCLLSVSVSVYSPRQWRRWEESVGVGREIGRPLSSLSHLTGVRSRTAASKYSILVLFILFISASLHQTDVTQQKSEAMKVCVSVKARGHQLVLYLLAEWRGSNPLRYWVSSEMSQDVIHPTRHQASLSLSHCLCMCRTCYYHGHSDSHTWTW